jgi:hypothetical protein
MLSVQNLQRSYGSFVVAQNHLVGHAGTVSLFSADHRGLWFISNVAVLADVPSEQAGTKTFLSLDQLYTSTYSNAEDAENIRQRVIGNTFVDLRSAANLQSGDSGSIEGLFEGIDSRICEFENNIIYVPNRTVTDPGIPGLTVVSSLDTDAFATVNYRGLWSPTPGNYNPVDLGTVDTDYATPTAAGMSGRVPTGSAILGDWSGDAPAFDISGRITSASRAPGAWAEDA